MQVAVKQTAAEAGYLGSPGAKAENMRVWMFSLAMLFTNQGISVVTGAVTAAFLTPALFGVVHLSRTLIVFLSVFCSLGLELGLQKRLPGRGSMAEKLGIVRLLRCLTFVLSVFTTILCILGGAEILERTLFKLPNFASALMITVVALPFASDMAVLGGAFRGIYRPFPALVAQSLVQPFVRLLSVLGCLAIGQAFIALPIGIVLGSFLGWAVAAYQSRRLHGTVGQGRVPFSAIREVLNYSGPLSLVVMIVMLTRMLDLFLVGYFRPATEVGQYSIVLLMTQLIGLTGIAFGQTLGTRIAAAYAEGNLKKIKDIQTTNMTRIAAIAAPLAACIVFWGDRIDLVIGHGYSLDWRVVAVAAAASSLIGTMDNVGHTLGMTGHHNRELSIVAAGFALQTLACLTLIPAGGQLGAATASLTTALFIFLARLWTIRRVLGLVTLTAKIAFPFAAALAISLGVFAATSSLQGRTLLSTALSCVIVAVLYSGLMAATARNLGLKNR